MGKYKVGDRFEIEISEIINDAVAHIGPYYKIKGFDSFVFDEKSLERLEESEVDWTKVKVDTPILVSIDEEHWYRRYFAGYRDNMVYAWNEGATSWSVNCEEAQTYWDYAKLAEVENE